MKINNNQQLEDGENISHMKCPKNKQKFREGFPDTIIIHYTAGRDAESSAKYLCKDNVKASAHLVIGRDGKIIQLVPFDTITWHAGTSEYGSKKGLNKYSIGIELDNAGILKKEGNEFISWFGKKYTDDQVIYATHRNEKQAQYWHIFTEKQIKTCEEVCSQLIKKYSNIKTILGHEEIAPGRKQDPGPAFPLDKLRNHLIFNDRESDELDTLPEFGTVIPSKLNIRTGPGKDFEKAALPLTEGTKVKILGQQSGWYHVSTEITGWVAKKYIKIN